MLTANRIKLDNKAAEVPTPGIVMAHFMGLGKIIVALLDWLFDTYKLRMQNIIDSEPEQHYMPGDGRGTCPRKPHEQGRIWWGFRCLCEPDHALKNVYAERACDIHITERALIGQFVDEYTEVFDLEKIQEILGASLTLAIAHDKRQLKEEQGRQVCEITNKNVPDDAKQYLLQDVDRGEVRRLNADKEIW